MKLASILFAGLFALGAAVQWNDPDPLVWMLGYGAAACLSLATAFGRPFFAANLAATLVFTIWFLSLASSLVGAPSEAFTSFKMHERSHEEPREAGGLALLAGWSGVLAVHARCSRRVGDPLVDSSADSRS